MSTENALPEKMPELPPAPPREPMIATAIKFLQSTKVSESPMEQKKQFLVKKGLTNEEIEIAISKSGVAINNGIALPLTSGISSQVALHPVSTWTRIREYSSIAIIVGGVIYGLYALYKRFIEPIFMGSAKAQEEKLEKMEEGVKTIQVELTQNMQEIRSVMDEMQNQLETQSGKISQVAANLTSYKSQSSQGTVTDSAIGELKAEITSVKGLLLSRNQFPAQPVNKPIIPSWQLKPPPPSSEPKTDSASTQERTADALHPDTLENGHSSSDGSESGEDSQIPSNVKQTHVNGFASSDKDMQKNLENPIINEET